MTQIDTGTPDLLATVEDGVGIVTLNRPDRRNALSLPMIDGLAHALDVLERDDAVGAVLLTGAGEAFCAGGDVKGMADPGAEPPYDARLQQVQISQRRTSGRLWAMPKPTIAALPGAAAGAGFSLALSCDLRYASDTAILTSAFAKVGLPGDFGGSWFLTQLVGPAKAKELSFFSERIDADRALALGLVNAVFPAAALRDEALGRARQLANGPRIALRYMKENLNRATVAELSTCIDLEAVHHAHTRTTADHKEAVAAFNEKREPRYLGI